MNSSIHCFRLKQSGKWKSYRCVILHYKLWLWLQLSLTYPDSCLETNPHASTESDSLIQKFSYPDSQSGNRGVRISEAPFCGLSRNFNDGGSMPVGISQKLSSWSSNVSGSIWGIRTITYNPLSLGYTYRRNPLIALHQLKMLKCIICLHIMVQCKTCFGLQMVQMYSKELLWFSHWCIFPDPAMLYQDSFF